MLFGERCYGQSQLMERGLIELFDEDWSLLTEEEQAIILNEDIEKDPTPEELKRLVPGYKQRILTGVLARIEEWENSGRI